ncbi:MAG: hypothetical protein COX57_04415 [Alphaproteobacteria bacterium CG_4_10_14_0_2_um_filter_63_37]|nr:MAG: hypothetical protein AUJ55_08045 [Proteobacteria bacterium CG1_02_64_396]PJA25285.1 MAG: hypothetical protein COX57_04415 [Alphaproteobacteria bacterium CG_4_10_14_0_2_um_filter_63_37]
MRSTIYATLIGVVATSSVWAWGQLELKDSERSLAMATSATKTQAVIAERLRSRALASESKSRVLEAVIEAQNGAVERFQTEADAASVLAENRALRVVLGKPPGEEEGGHGPEGMNRWVSGLLR